jgi:pimeloyl-ACP methyl ester carboxylesterase
MRTDAIHLGRRVPILLLALAATWLLPMHSPAAELPPASITRVFGQRIVYYDAGTGPVLVLLHGLGSSATFDWGKVILPLSERYRVIAPDQIGFGASDKPTIDYSIQTWVEFLGEFLRNLRVTHMMLAGESLGGWIAAEYAIEAGHPGSGLPAVDRLILVDAAGHRSLIEQLANNRSESRPPIFGRGPGTLEQLRASLARVFYNKNLLTDDVVRAEFIRKLASRDGDTVTSLFRDTDLLLSQCVDAHLQEIRAPTLVVWGKKDELVPLSDGEDFASRIPRARLAVIPDCGHAPPIEKPKEFLQAAVEFLGGPSAAR